ncbi:hypothetical protein PR202_ga19194 [Eleusine coracana subsp. coracana]|uniref:F-box associated domain-containing protein n=1 Tax=Eleusine coracana subsp. coracana TaxID=191504 RepID=A0AAV5CTW6_ELECO|nr:hypothetical protein QOZ80_4AG0305730 [Eleusine coracana subsp. coracana]GJN01892.1 hypothetical protein PR202_ga19194 [Eleusine coracana subsp. coracana]
MEILAIDIDNEKVSTIDMPGNKWYPSTKSGLLLISGRPCLLKNDASHRALWILTVDHQWERRCVFKVEDDLIYCPIKGVWDCSGVLVMYFYNKTGDNKLLLYQVTKEKMWIENLPHKEMAKGLDYAFCWGYRPTLLSLESILGKINQDVEQHHSRKVDTMEAMKPFKAQDKLKEQKGTMLGTVRFMEYLICVMENQKLSKNKRDVIEIPL